MSKFWKDKRVFITGTSGFKGSWLVLWLLNAGAKVKGYSTECPFSPDLNDTLGIAGEFEYVKANINDEKTLFREIVTFQPEIVLHLAAQSLVLPSYKDPIETYDINVLGTAKVLHSSYKVDSVKVVLNVTTDKCYENNEWEWGYREVDRLGGHDPYSSSKACSEILTKSFRKSFFKDTRSLVSARAGNVIGGGDWSVNRLVPDLMRSFRAGSTLEIRSPGAIRPWQYVLEPIRCYLKLAELYYLEQLDVEEDCWNIGPTNEGCISVKELLSKFKKQSYFKNVSVEYPEIEFSHEANFLKLDCSKIGSYAGLKPVLNIDETISFTAEWYARYFSGEKMKGFSLGQIKRFQD